jgi:phosphate transport system substrate-binding protein
LLAAAACATALAGCGQQREVNRSVPTVRVDGSSTVFLLSEAAAEGFSSVNRGATRVAVGESGTGGGFRRFCSRETEVQGASRPILSGEIESCRTAGVSYVELPVAFDGLTVVVHPSNPVASMRVAELRRMWEPRAQGKITNWRQVNPAWPDMPLLLFGAGTASGTFDFFTEAIVGEDGASRTDYTPTEDDNVTVQGVASNRGGVGYFGIAYYEQNRNRLKAVAIDNGDGAIAPSAASVANGTYRPLSRPLFIYVNAQALRLPHVRQFVDYYVANAARLAPKVGYVPLPASAYEALARRVGAGQTGTAFGGRQAVGASIEDILARPLADAAAASPQ